MEPQDRHVVDSLRWSPIWSTDNPPSRRWPLYTRGNVGEVSPDVVRQFTWDLIGRGAEDGWRDAFRAFGLLQRDDLDPDESMVVLGVFGGYCYINASFVRMLGVRTPGANVAGIDRQFFGESDAPTYVPRAGDRNVRASLQLGRTLLRLLRTRSLPALDDDRRDAIAFAARRPPDDATDAELLAYCTSLRPLFRRLFARHIECTFAVALVSSALVDLCAEAGMGGELVSILGGIGDIESALPSPVVWRLGRDAAATPAVDAAFDAGIDGLLDRLRALPEAAPWLDGFDAFLAEYGFRGPNEWEVGSDPWAFEPKPVLAAIDRMRTADVGHDPVAQVRRLAAGRRSAVTRVRGALGVVGRFRFDAALAATVVYSQGRERTKTTIVRALHEVRLAHRVLAARAAANGGPTDRTSACLLDVDELRAFLADPPSAAATIHARATLLDRLSSVEPPFVVDGAVPPLETWRCRDRPSAHLCTGTVLRGIAGCPGIARGRARIVLDPSEPGDLGAGDVLVAPITDPSWTPLFLAADAVVVDVGATMSHAVIVSRELGIPCVVSVTGATRTIPDGALIEVDGNAGTVTVLEDAPAPV